jgi:hypothetical protein
MRPYRPLVALSVLLLGACYRYAPLDAPAPTGASVRLHLAPAEAASLATTLGAGTAAVEGTIVEASDTTFVLAVTGTRRAGESTATPWGGDRVTVPRRAVASVEARRLDRRRTATVVGLAALGAVAVRALVSAIDALAGGEDPGTGPIVTP